MAEEYSAGTLSADLTVDTTGLNKGIDQASDALDKLERKADDASDAFRQGFQKASESVKDTESHVGDAEKALDHLQEAVEALGLYEVFSEAKKIVGETIEAFDENTKAFRAMQAQVGAIDSSKFAELSEQLASVSRNSQDTIQSTIALSSRMGLSNQAIAELLPRLQDFAATTGKDLPSAMQAFSLAISQGQLQPKRMGITLDDMQKAAFEAGDEMQKVGVLMDALSGYAGNSTKDVESAAGAMKRYANQSDELKAAVGSLIDKPVAEFFNAIYIAVKALTKALDSFSPMTKEILGNIAAIVGVTGSAALAFAGVSKTLSVMSAIIGPMNLALPTLSGGFTGIATAVGAMLAPLAAAAFALASVATAYGAIRNAMEGKFSDNVFGTLKDGFNRAVADAKGMLADLQATTEKELGGFQGKGSSGLDFSTKGSKNNTGSDAFSVLNASLKTKAEKLDFSESKDVFAAIGEELRGTALDFSDKGGGLRDKHEGYEAEKDPFDAASTAFDKLNDKLDRYGVHMDVLDDFTTGLTESFEKTTDANSELQEAIAKAKDQAEERVNQAFSQMGGPFTDLAAGITATDSTDEASRKLAGTSTAAKVGTAIVGGAVGQQGGAAAQVAGGVISAATGNPAGLAQAGLAILQQSASFQKIMDAFNKVIGAIVKVIDPIIAILSKTLVPILDLVTDVLMFVAKVIVDAFVNPLLEAWNWMIDMIDDALGWLGVDLSGMKASTIDLDDATGDSKDDNATSANTDATKANTKALDMAAQNIPQGFKTALDAFNAYGGGPSSATTAQALAKSAGFNPGASWIGKLSADQQLAKSEATRFNPLAVPASAMQTTPTAGTTTGTAGVKTKAATQTRIALPTSNVSSSIANTSNSNQTVVVNATVQAATPDLLAEMQKMLKTKGYLASGTNLMGATARTQYGSA